MFILVKQKDSCDRISDHIGYIRQKKENQPIGAHFNRPGHTLADLVVEGIERVLPKGNDALRKIRESYYINEYNATKYGANVRD